MAHVFVVMSAYAYLDEKARLAVGVLPLLQRMLRLHQSQASLRGGMRYS